MANKLNDKQIKALICSGVPGKHAAGLRITPKGTALWMLLELFLSQGFQIGKLYQVS
jgi:hypothetical protein